MPTRASPAFRSICVAQLAAIRLVRMRGEVSLIEEEVQHVVHGREGRAKCLERPRLNVDQRLAQSLARPRRS
jgi:hypothetical protein